MGGDTGEVRWVDKQQLYLHVRELALWKEVGSSPAETERRGSGDAGFLKNPAIRWVLVLHFSSYSRRL